MPNITEMPFLDHLEELRWHILRSTIAVLLVAIVAAIALTLRASRQVKTPNVEEQLRTNPADRIRLVDIETD